MATSKIEWTEATWNPTTGCNKISSGCKNCYAEIMANRLQAMGVEKYRNGFQLENHPEALLIPYQWKKPRVIFVNSMSDLFHKKVPDYFIQEVFEVMNECPQHTFQVLTKRSDRLLELSPHLNWTPNIWMGVSVENEKVISRCLGLVRCGAKTKFLSLEPLIGPLSLLPLLGIDWVIVGGESGPKARPMKKEWILDIRDRCFQLDVPFFFKQWGGKNKKKAGRILEGKTWDEMPSASWVKI